MDITPTWTTMIRELALMASRGCQREEWAESFDFAIEELKRVGKFLDSLPKEEQPPLPKPQLFLQHCERCKKKNYWLRWINPLHGSGPRDGEITRAGCLNFRRFYCVIFYTIKHELETSKPLDSLSRLRQA